ncbi:hypothetical protein H8J79_04085 [Clostridium perfringens]|uniref:hypothetical protein n=1 Tax=Clostridium perfringens TaxID=1502 RepID=UPI0018E4350B|nr:hypothetical protein [Clostridium perfringens]MBI6020013.1 hypothetical protein [Clostridium perfringens]
MLELKNYKINWTDFFVLKRKYEVERENIFPKPQNKLSYSYDFLFFNREIMERAYIKPDEYYKWAKDYWNKYGEKMNLRQRIETISHIKRFIDCKCDLFLRELGYNQEINIKNYKFIKKHILSDQAPQISLCSYLLDLNMIIVSEIRSLRNKVEHDYLKPTINDVIRAISVADLFKLAFKDKINNIIYLCEVMSIDKNSSIEIFLHKEDGNDIGELSLSNPVITINNLNLRSEDEYYCEVLRMLISYDFKELPQILGVKMPKEYINFNVVTSECDIDAEIYKRKNGEY